MNKNLKRVISIVSVAAVAVMGFAACGHEHSFETDWTYDSDNHWHNATCEHDDEQGGLAKHSFTETVLKAATCTETGSVQRTCICGYTVTVDTAALRHNLVQVPYLAATCEAEGHTDGYICSRCDYKQGVQTIQKLKDHVYSTAWEYGPESHWHPALCGCGRVSNEANHDQSGEGGVCSVCGYDPNAEQPGDFVYETYSGGGYIVTGLTEAGKTNPNLEIPEALGSRKILAIQDFAFENETGIETITLPASLATIGREAFSGCTNLKSVSFAEGLTTIGYAAFLNCSSLEGAALPASLKTLNAYAFTGCSSLTTATLPTGLTTLGEQVFGGCSKLEAITIPAGITEIGNNMFQNCSSLASVTLHDGITRIGDNAFARCTSLKEIDLHKVNHIGQNAFRGSGLVTVTVPATVGSGDIDTLNVNAFADCLSLKSATVLAIKDYYFGGWFAGCSALEELTIPFVGANVTPKDNAPTAFGFAFGINEPENVSAFKKVTQDGKDYYIPNSLKTVTVLGGTISAGAFDGCSMLTSIIAESGVTVNAESFTDCTATITKR